MFQKLSSARHTQVDHLEDRRPLLNAILQIDHPYVLQNSQLKWAPTMPSRRLSVRPPCGYQRPLRWPPSASKPGPHVSRCQSCCDASSPERTPSTRMLSLLLATSVKWATRALFSWGMSYRCRNSEITVSSLLLPYWFAFDVFRDPYHLAHSVDSPCKSLSLGLNWVLVDHGILCQSCFWSEF